MDKPTLDALKHLMEHIGLRATDSKSLHEDWLRVAAWMQEEEKELDYLETLGTDDPRHDLRGVR
jgi:hypothetical protein